VTLQSEICNLKSAINMIVGTLRVRLLLREARTLKDKRQVVQSIKDRLRQSFNVSVAEVEEQDQPRSVVVGIAMVCNEAHPIKKVLGEIVNALKAHPIAEYVDSEMEV
jgi:uncharacterized protein YlxP (DUF503 family)